jgi:hypothetical protein
MHETWIIILNLKEMWVNVRWFRIPGLTDA